MHRRLRGMDAPGVMRYNARFIHVWRPLKDKLGWTEKESVFVASVSSCNNFNHRIT